MSPDATAILSDSVLPDSDVVVTPEELLRTLLDSRGQTVLSADQPTHPTKIQAMQTLREESHRISDLADRIDVSRQTVYRALHPCIDAGFVRATESEYTLTCSGGAVLQAYHEACEVIERDALTRLARARHQLWVLETLETAPARKAVLASTGRQVDGPSRATVHRIVDEFVDGGYVVQHAGSNELTEDGHHLLGAYLELRETVGQALDKREFLRWLPADIESFPVSILGESTLIQNSPDHPHNVLDALLRVADPSLETFEGMATIVSPTIAQAYRPVLSGNTRVAGVFPDEVLFGLHKDPEFIDYVKQQGFTSYIREGFAARDAELLFVPEMPPIHLAIFDGTRVIISLAPSTGVSDVEASAIDSTDPRLVGWAKTYFESYHVRGRPPLRAFLDRSLGYTPGAQHQAGD